MPRRVSILRSVALIAALIVGLPAAVRADVRLPNVLGSNMVLQRDAPVAVWGWANPGEQVTVQLGEQSAKAKAGTDGRWSVKLKGQPAGGPATLTVAASNTITLENILFGDVWVCSGQSNMQWALRQANNPQEEIKNANHPQLRLYYVPRKPAFRPQSDIEAQWQVCTPESATGFSAVAYFFGRKLQAELGVPIGLINTSWGGTRIEPWTPPTGFDQVPAVAELGSQVRARNEQPPAQINQQIPGVLYNGMVDPLVPLSVKGAIWYQGESNRGEGMLYHEKMKALILGWRTMFRNPELPFYFVQLAPYTYRGDEYQLPEIWEAQTATLALPHTGMAVTTDIGNIKDIHPRNKQEVGRRLALAALAKTYGQDIVYSGPIFKSAETDGHSMRVTFEHAAGLTTNDGEVISHFELAGKDLKYAPATAKVDGDALIVTAEGISQPVTVRFGWHQTAEPNLVNGAGLPASPFRYEPQAD